jgi:drug/metabolite transporter (DMT)-like permease
VSLGFGLGILAGVAFGAGDVLAGLVARQVGTLRTVFGGLVVSLLTIALVFVLAGEALPSDAATVVLVGWLGIIRAVGYLALVQAFSIGPLAVVSPITGAGGAFTVLMAVALLGDRPSVIQWVAVPVATVGAVLVATVSTPDRRQLHFASRGVAYALGALVLLSYTVVTQQAPIREIGWVPTILIRRAFEMVATGFIVLLLARRWRLPGTWSGDASAASEEADKSDTPGMGRVRLVKLLLLIGLVGLLDTAGLASLSAGLAEAPAWLIGLLASASPAVAVVVGILFFHERLQRHQWAGVVLVGIGVALAAFP